MKHVIQCVARPGVAALLALALTACTASIDDVDTAGGSTTEPATTTDQNGNPTTGTDGTPTDPGSLEPGSVEEPQVLPPNNGSITIPTAHPRLWFNTARLDRAKAYFRTHPYTVASVTGPDAAMDAAMRTLITGDAASCRLAVEWAKSITFTLEGVASDGARWYGEGVILTYDWCYSVMSDADRTLLRDRWNQYIEALNAKPWGGIGMEGNNYYTGYFRNTILWAIASYHENGTKAQAFLNYALDTRWRTSLLPYFNAGAKGGAPGEGSSYGRRTFGYLTVPFVSLGLVGRNMWDQTTYFLETVYWSIYSTTPGASHSVAGSPSLFETFPFNEDERWRERDARTNTSQTTLGSYFAPLMEQWRNQPVAGHAKKFMDLTGARIENRLVEYVYGDTVAATPARDLSSLPLDYYASGLKALYAKTAWNASATMVTQQFSPPTHVGHTHRDAGSFQIWRGGEFLSRETVGYAERIVGYDNTADVDCEAPVGHNTLLFNGLGTITRYRSEPTVLRMSSSNQATYAAVDLTGAYDVDAEWAHREAEVGNVHAGRVIRETLFIKPLETLLVFDRMESGNNDASVKKTFLVHFENAPTQRGNSLVGVSGTQELQVTTAVPANPTIRVVNERGASGQFRIGQFRAEIETSGAVVSHFLNVLQARQAGTPELTINVTENATSYTLNLSHPTKGKAVVTFQKGITSTGGSFGYAATGTPTAAPLRTTVQPMTVTASGPVWGN